VTSRVTESQPSQPEDDPHVHHAVVSDSEAGAPIERLSYQAEEVEPAAAHTEIVPVEHESPVAPAMATDVTPIVHAAEERIDCPPADPAGCPPWASAGCPPGTYNCPPPRSWPDEYICDGGDRGYPVHFNGPQRQGLESEDTIGEFVDENGDRQVRPSSRACVYAPRFASVRSISQPVLDYNIDKAAGAHDGVVLAGLEHELRPDTQAQFDQPSGINMRSRASGLGADAGESSVEQVETTEHHLKIQNVYEDRNFFSEGQFQQGIEPVLAYGIQMAGMWTRALNPVIVAADESGQQVTGEFKAEEYVGAEDRSTPGELEILKTADKAFAHPGDEITFTIRFSNGGGRPLYEVRIIDHLTPRIEYVPGSAISELDGRLDVTDEFDGTQVLTFELAEPLEGGQTGEITFRVNVR
jgi:uncharacterized repeat protein (TIGR01451 family)